MFAIADEISVIHENVIVFDTINFITNVVTLDLFPNAITNVIINNEILTPIRSVEDDGEVIKVVSQLEKNSFFMDVIENARHNQTVFPYYTEKVGNLAVIPNKADNYFSLKRVKTEIFSVNLMAIKMGEGAVLLAISVSMRATTIPSNVKKTEVAFKMGIYRLKVTKAVIKIH